MTDRTGKILEYFEQINYFPRCSNNETRLCQWLQQWAKDHNLDFQSDTAGNLVVRVPASAGYERAPVVVLQGHMDMVCEKTPESNHDFTKDAIISHREGDWLTADETTLGADNGIALAYMLALAEDPSIAHPPLELLFTVDEETGLNGAKNLKPDFVRGRILINLDSEDEGVFTIGCAGGIDTHMTLDVQLERVPADGALYKIIVGGLKGGHSGIDIHKRRGNANKILARTLSHIRAQTDMAVVTLSGGSRKNAIPRDAWALIWVEACQKAMIPVAVRHMENTVRAEFVHSDKDLFIKATPVPEAPSGREALCQRDTDHIIRMLLALPNAVAAMSMELEGLVETSSNLATVDIAGSRISVVSSQRSAIMSCLDEITAMVHSVAGLAGAAVQDQDAYPAWQPDMDSALLRRSKSVYRQLFGQEPVIQVIHAGLECAIIGDIYPGIDMISFGPTLCNPHSPDERLYIPSIAKVWDFLVALLAQMTP
jgi:dipeptidase D